jgi:GT2 family glycosyltransferase
VATVKRVFHKKFNRLRFIELDQNYGPAQARNYGAAIATGTYLAFLDNDTEVHPQWLVAAKKIFTQNQLAGCIQSKLLLLDHKNRLDYVGDYLNQYGLLSHRATYQDLDHGQFEQPAIIFAAKSAGMFIPKKVFDLVDGFDPDYFIYMEETDLCWRSWLQGYQCLYLPASIVYHSFSGSFKLLNNRLATYNLRFHGTKNYILTNLKNLSTRNLLLILPRLIIIYLFFSLYLLFIKFQPISFFYMLSGILWNLFNIGHTLNKRHFIQQKRIIPDSQLFPYIFRKVSLLDKINKSILLPHQ